MSDRPWEQVDYELAETMSSYWTNFAKNRAIQMAMGYLNGPSCSESNKVSMILGTKTEAKEIPYKEGLEFLDNYMMSNMLEKIITKFL